jgi:two-component system chemotaxis response regulator CheY
VKNILVVEDSSTTRSMIRAALEEMEDFSSVEAGTGFEALKMLPTQSFDLIITDINMPDINGLELISFVKNHPSYKDIPLLIVSTERSEEDIRRGIELGAAGYITKPFRPEDLREIVKKTLGL